MVQGLYHTKQRAFGIEPQILFKNEPQIFCLPLTIKPQVVFIKQPNILRILREKICIVLLIKICA